MIFSFIKLKSIYYESNHYCENFESKLNNKVQEVLEFAAVPCFFSFYEYILYT